MAGVPAWGHGIWKRVLLGSSEGGCNPPGATDGRLYGDPSPALHEDADQRATGAAGWLRRCTASASWEGALADLAA